MTALRSNEAGGAQVELEAAEARAGVPPPRTGTLLEILVPEVESADVRAHIATIET